VSILKRIFGIYDAET